MKSFKKIPFMALALFTLAFISSCKKEETDTTKPKLTILEPSMNDTISNEVHIEFSVTDNIGLKELSVKIINGSGTELFSKIPTVTDLKVYSFHEHYDISALSILTLMTVIITAKDKSNNIETKTIPIIAIP